MERISQEADPPSSGLGGGAHGPPQLSQAWAVGSPRRRGDVAEPSGQYLGPGTPEPWVGEVICSPGDSGVTSRGQRVPSDGQSPALSLFYWDEIHAQKACAPRAQLRTACRVNATNKARGVPTPRGPRGFWRRFPCPERTKVPSAGMAVPFWGVTNVTSAGWASLLTPCLLPPHLLSSRFTHIDTHMNSLLLFISTILLLDVLRFAYSFSCSGAALVNTSLGPFVVPESQGHFKD